MRSIRQASMPQDQDTVRELFAEYLNWVCPILLAEYQAAFDPQVVLAADMQKIDIFLPPQGGLFLAFADETVAGCSCARRIGPSIAELKRMFVRPEYRRLGIGRSLVERTIQSAAQAGYTAIRLDSARFMGEAHALYYSLGFRDIPPYPESEIPQVYHSHWVFMELVLPGNRIHE